MYLFKIHLSLIRIYRDNVLTVGQMSVLFIFCCLGYTGLAPGLFIKKSHLGMSHHSSGQCSQNAQRQAEDQVGRKFDVVSSFK